MFSLCPQERLLSGIRLAIASQMRQCFPAPRRLLSPCRPTAASLRPLSAPAPLLLRPHTGAAAPPRSSSGSPSPPLPGHRLSRRRLGPAPWSRRPLGQAAPALRPQRPGARCRAAAALRAGRGRGEEERGRPGPLRPAPRGAAAAALPSRRCVTAADVTARGGGGAARVGGADT